jgi:gentisate 1,2-dioxygenase
MARYARIRSGAHLSTRLRASGEIYYVIRGSGESKNGSDTIAWQPGDIFCFPGGDKTTHSAPAETAVLLMFTDEPLLAFEGVAPPAAGKGPIQAVHYPAGEIKLHLNDVRARTASDDASGVAVQFVSDATDKLGTCLPSIALAVNSLEAGRSQRAHLHNSVALTLCIQGKGCYSTIDGQRVDWQPDAVMVTPPTAVHSHHNEGDNLMTCLIAQDSGLYYQARTIGFRFAE